MWSDRLSVVITIYGYRIGMDRLKPILNVIDIKSLLIISLSIETSINRLVMWLPIAISHICSLFVVIVSY